MELVSGLCGRWSYFLKAHPPARWALPPFQTALISALFFPACCATVLASVDEKKYFTPWRHTGALFAVIATVLSCRHSGTRLSCQDLPFWQGYSLAGSLRNAKVAEATGSMLVSITWNSLSACVPRRAGDPYRISHVTVQLPDTWWMYLGGPRSAVHRANGDSGEALGY